MHQEYPSIMGHVSWGPWLVMRCRRAALACLLVPYVACPLEVRGQVTALEDIIPLAQVETTIGDLETRPNDLVQFATSYADALRELKIAQLSGETLQTLRPSAVITPLEMQIAGINARAAEMKVVMIRAVIEKQIAATDAKLRILRRLETIEQEAEPEGGTASQVGERIAQAEATKSILQMILDDETGRALHCASTDRKSRHAESATGTASPRATRLAQQRAPQRRSVD
jgi:hypothetical protein